MRTVKDFRKQIAFIAVVAALCFGFTAAARLADTDGASASEAAVSYLTEDESAPDVYMTADISPEGLMAVYNRLGFTPEGNVAVKLSTGEPPASNYLDPNLIKDLVQSVNGTIVECNTAYGGSRSSTAMHRQVAEDHGFTEIANVDIMDEDGSMPIPVTGGTNLTENLVGSHLANYDSMITLSHFKGHAMAGFGGAIKNMSIGVASREGKSWIHTSGNSTTSPWGGDQDGFLESMAEATSSVIDYMDGKVVYVNVMNNISIDCDCDGNPAAPDMHDVGILASTDPVALDQACIDIVYNTDREQSGSLINRIEQRNGLHTLEHAAEIGLGSREYNLVDIDTQSADVSMSYENGALTISGLTGEANLIRATYSGGILTGIEILDAANGTQNIAAEPGDRFFLWDDTESMRPLSETATVGEGDADQDGGALVVYFSATGNTERVAGYIASAADADVFEITPTDPYTSEDLRWTDENSRVSVEHNNPDQREVELVSTTVPDWESYDTVFIGYPIWWGIAAWPVNGFIEANDFSGKTVIPFCTSSSSGLGESGQLLEELAGTGDWLDGRRFSSGTSEATVRDWVESLEL